MPLSLLVRLSAGLAFMGVLSLALAVIPPFAVAEAALLIWVVPAGTGVITLTAKLAEPDARAARARIVSVQAEPAIVPAQLQPAALLAVLKVVFAGTVSLSTTPVRPILPLLL